MKGTQRQDAAISETEGTVTWEGITDYLQNVYAIDSRKKGNMKRIKNLLKKFLNTKNLDCREENTESARWQNANIIQANFPAFATWLTDQNLSHFS